MKLANHLFYNHCPVRKESHSLSPLKLERMATPNEISLILGLIVSGLFYVQYKRYEAQAEREEIMDSFLEERRA